MKTIPLGGALHPSEQVLTIGPRASLRDAWQSMRGRSVHHLVVVEGGAILGMLSARDLLDQGLDGGGSLRSDLAVENIMATTKATLTERSDVQEALSLMGGRTTALPLVHRGALIGLVTESDLLQVVAGLLSREPPGAQAADRSYAIFANPLVQNLMDLLGQAGI